MIFDLKNRPVKPPQGGVLALGCFDGIHLGHQKVISRMRSEGREKKLKTVLGIFYPHPFQVLNPEKPFHRLLTLRETELVLKNQALDFAGLVRFSKKFSLLRPEDFIRYFIVPLFKPAVFVAGYDFSFGRDRSGSVFDLKNFGKKEGFEVITVAARKAAGEVVSTSRIKKALSAGQTDEAARLLGRAFFFQARVVKGRGMGAILGCPTANLSLPEEKLLLKRGVYSATVWISGRKAPAVMNIGSRPTFFSDGANLTVEVHIIAGEAASLSGKILKVEPGRFIRKERAFKNRNELKNQIQKDVRAARLLHAAHT